MAGSAPGGSPPASRSSSRAVLQQGSPPAGRSSTRTVLHKDSPLPGQSSTRTVLRQDSPPGPPGDNSPGSRSSTWTTLQGQFSRRTTLPGQSSRGTVLQGDCPPEGQSSRGTVLQGDFWLDFFIDEIKTSKMLSAFKIVGTLLGYVPIATHTHTDTAWLENQLGEVSRNQSPTVTHCAINP